MRTLVSLFTAIVLVLSGQHSDVFADEGLSIGVDIKTGDSGNSDIGATRNLWIAVQQGNTIYRDFTVVGSKKYNLKVIPEITQMLFVNDKPTFSTELSPANSWIKFQEQFMTDFVVKAGKTKRFTMAITPPFDISDQIFDAYLVIRVEAVDEKGRPLTAETGASVPLKAQLATPMWLGVGNPKKYRLNVKINDIQGVRYGGKKYLRIYAQNNGRSPIAPQGRIQLKNLDFQMPSHDPYEFYTFGVKPRTPFSFDVEMDKEMPRGKWSVLAELRQGNYIVTKNFRKNITFKTLDRLDGDNPETASMGIGQYSNLLFPLIGLVLVALAFWRMQTSNKRLKRELSIVGRRPPDDST
jgi:hypothetical protein